MVSGSGSIIANRDHENCAGLRSCNNLLEDNQTRKNRPFPGCRYADARSATFELILGTISFPRRTTLLIPGAKEVL